ncbi:MAG: M15 family metallopeptidase, partial [Balneolales bacterium]|nr:M15 family metallopeptidase [Balneolales bacterium]
LQENGIWNDDCPLHYSRLAKVEVEHIGFDGQVHSGVLLVLEEIKADVNSIFQELFRKNFPIQHLRPIEHYEGSDLVSMEANNSYAFCGRKIAGTNRWSSHAFGVAIDINPRQNPVLYLNESDSTIKVEPSGSLEFINRGIQKPGMVEPVVKIFEKHGFTEWGGNWELKPDYHHFQVPWSRIKELFPEANLP